MLFPEFKKETIKNKKLLALIYVNVKNYERFGFRRFMLNGKENCMFKIRLDQNKKPSLV